MATTLSVPEILSEILPALKQETPEVFGPEGFAKDFSSDTAVLGDRITAHISHLPVTGDYVSTAQFPPPPAVAGFKAPAQNATTLLEDVPVTLEYMPSVTVQIPWLTRMATKGVSLYKAAIVNKAYALGKYIVDFALQQSVSGMVSNSITVSPSIVTLDTFDRDFRCQCNAQKMKGAGRWCLLNPLLATMLGADDRTKSKLFVGQLNDDEGIRRWHNVAGFSWIREYPDMPAGPIGKVAGLMGEGRLVRLVVRKLHSSASIARALGIPVIMDDYQIRDEESGLELTGLAWQESGTGDTYVTVVILCGFAIGNQGGAAGSMTDNAGCLIVTP